MKEKVLIVYGGKSVEHDISIITAQQVMKYLPKEYDFLPVYVDKNGVWWIADNLRDIKIYSKFDKFAKNKRQITLILGENVLAIKKKNKFLESFKVAAVLNCCHGNIGEDGSVQGVFKTCGIAHTSSKVTSSSLCMDKAFMKDVFSANGISSPEYVYFNKCTYDKSKAKMLKRIETEIKYPLIVKPANLGSSIGISVCRDEKNLRDAVDLAFEFDNKILVEKLVENLREFNCACFEFKGKTFASKVNEVKNKSGIYSFDDKYLSETGKNQEADKALSKKVRNLTEKIYKLFDCSGIVRIDFLFDDKSSVLYVNEINTIPGSLAFYLFNEIPFRELLSSVIEECRVDFEKEQRLIKAFESDALKIFENVAETTKK